ncbi:uncharacterized protein LOC126033427 [Suncus etruscus]|uniref:uncharacterized protein LOC126033427 n=1 Tax=Suncus etruscus TaxID=109475 RepID=UPI002110A08D|nr:uncharacterized protein LOC126033427 [Suncus etruscus]
MRLSVRAPRRARPELFVNDISGAFIAPEPPATEKPPPPPPQTRSCAPGAPASRRPGCEGSVGQGGSRVLRPGIWRPRQGDESPSPGGKRNGRRAGQGSALSTLQSSPHHRWIEGEIEIKMVGESAAQVNDLGGSQSWMEMRPEEGHRAVGGVGVCGRKAPSWDTRGHPWTPNVPPGILERAVLKLMLQYGGRRHQSACCWLLVGRAAPDGTARPGLRESRAPSTS